MATNFVLLSEVPVYLQGADNACGYHCAAMMRAAINGDAWLARFWAQRTGRGLGLPKFPTNEHETCVRPGTLASRMKDILRGGPLRITDPFDAADARKKIVAALRDFRPTILLLPKSSAHPDGHYVVVKGYRRTGEDERFIVNDPSVGESELGATEGQFAQLMVPTHKPTSGDPRPQAFVATTRTFLRRRVKR